MELIDIKLEQINEWLVLRRKLDKNWSRSLKPIESRQALSISKLQEDKTLSDLIPEGLQGFLQARTILEKLKNSEKTEKSRNLFGNYNSQLLYNWEYLQKLYEKNNLHLADCAKHLLQLGVYEIPSLKSTLQSYEKQIKDSQNKESALNEEISKKNKSFKEKCKSYNIEGLNLTYELKQTTRKIPEIYTEILSVLKSEEFTELLTTYEKMTHENHGSIVYLPTIKRLRDFNSEVDLEKIKDKYCKVIKETMGEESEDDVIEIVEEHESEWVIEMIDEGKVIPVIDDDLPLSHKPTRSDLQTELAELEGFSEVLGSYSAPISRIFQLFSSLRELILIHEQSGYLDSIIGNLNKSLNHNLHEKLVECQKLQDNLKESIKVTHKQLCELLRFASLLIAHIETSINVLFPNISVKVIGETVKDIKHYLA